MFEIGGGGNGGGKITVRSDTSVAGPRIRVDHGIFRILNKKNYTRQDPVSIVNHFGPVIHMFLDAVFLVLIAKLTVVYAQKPV